VTAQGDFINDHGAHTVGEIVADDTSPCATCGERPPRPGRLRCQECLDAEWLRLRAKDPAWYERHKDYHRPG